MEDRFVMIHIQPDFGSGPPVVLHAVLDGHGGEVIEQSMQYGLSRLSLTFSVRISQVSLSNFPCECYLYLFTELLKLDDFKI
jgi:hypothetical protein